jgi:hypothetical protein
VSSNQQHDLDLPTTEIFRIIPDDTNTAWSDCISTFELLHKNLKDELYVKREELNNKCRALWGDRV